MFTKQKREELEASIAEKDEMLSSANALIEQKVEELENAKAELEVATEALDDLKTKIEAKDAEVSQKLESFTEEVAEAAAKRAAEIVADASGEQPIEEGRPVVAEVDGDEKILREYEALADGPEKLAFLDKNEAALTRAKEKRG